MGRKIDDVAHPIKRHPPAALGGSGRPRRRRTSGTAGESNALATCYVQWATPCRSLRLRWLSRESRSRAR